MRVLIAHPFAPGLDRAAEHLAILTFRSQAQHARCLGRVKQGIEFHHRNLLPLGRVADLVVANHRRPRPSLDYIGANVPHHYIASLSRRDQSAYDKPSVLRFIAAIEQQDGTAVGSDGHARRRIFRRQYDALACSQRLRLHCSIRCFLHRPVRVTWEYPRIVVHQIRLAKIECWQKLQIEPSLPHERGRNGLVELHGNSKSSRLGLQVDAVAQPTIRIAAERRNLVRTCAALSFLEIRNRVPLLRRRRQPHVPAGSNALVVQDDFHPVHLLIAEYPVIFVVEQQHAQATSLQHVVLRQVQIGTRPRKDSSVE